MENQNPTTSIDPAILSRAMEELDQEYSARSPSASMPPEPTEQPQADRPSSTGVRGLWDSIGAGMAKAGIETKDFIFGEPEEAEKSDFRKGVERRANELSGASTANALTMGVSQFATGMVGAGKFMAPFKITQKLSNAGKTGRAAYEVTKGAIAGAVAIDPHEERLSNLVQEFPALQNPVTEYLAADPTDSAAEGRFKNALEGIGLDLAIIGVFGASVRAYRHLRDGDEAKAAKELASIEQGRQANAQPPEASAPEAAIEAHTAPPASGESIVPADMPATAGEAPRADDGRIEFEERAAILEYEEGLPRADAERRAADETGYQAKATEPSADPIQSGGASPDLTSPVPDAAPRADLETSPSASALRPALMDLSPEAVSKIVLESEADLKAITKFGSREAALEAGQMTARSASQLPWQKLQTPDGLRELMSNAATATKSQMDAIKGGDVLSDATVNAKVRELADWYGEDPASLMGELMEAGENAAQMTSRMEAAYLISNRMFQETYDLSFKLRNGMLEEWGGDAVKATEELRQRLRLSATVLASAQSIRSNTGRTMRRMRGQFQFKPEDLQALDGMDASKLAEVIYSTKGDPKKLAQVANPTFLQRVMNEATFSLTNSLLWLYPTHTINIASNLYMLAGRPTEKLLGGIVMGPKAGGDILRRQAVREYSATVAALGDAWQAGIDAFRQGDSILSPHNTEFFQGGVTQKPLQWKPIANVGDLSENIWKAFNYRNVVGLPTRTLGAVDEFFKTLRYRAHVQGQAASEATAKGLFGDDFKRYVSERMEKAIDPGTGKALDQRALLEAQATTFQSELLPKTAGATIQQVRTRHPVLNFVLPFVKTPINVLRYGWKMTPGINLLQSEYQQAIKGGLGAEAQAHAIGQMTLGATFMGIAATLTLNGKITGGGPKDPLMQQELKATGWQPYSFVIEGQDGSKRYVPLGKLDPMAMPFTMVADLVEAMRQNPDGNDGEAGMGAALLSIAKSFSDRTFLQNIHQTLEALSDDTGTKAEKWLGGVAGNTIPMSSALRGYVNSDPYLRDARGFVDNMLKGLPGYSDTLPPIRDAFGEPVWRRTGLTTTDEADEVEAEVNRIMLETGKGLGKPSSKLGEADLRDITLKSGRNAYDRLQELSGKLPKGQSLKQRLAEIIRTDWYQELPDGDSDVKGTRLNVLSLQVRKYREVAKATLLTENAELQGLAYQRQKDAFITRERNKGRERSYGKTLMDALQPN